MASVLYRRRAALLRLLTSPSPLSHRVSASPASAAPLARSSTVLAGSTVHPAAATSTISSAAGSSSSAAGSFSTKVPLFALAPAPSIGRPILDAHFFARGMGTAAARKNVHTRSGASAAAPPPPPLHIPPPPPPPVVPPSYELIETELRAIKNMVRFGLQLWVASFVVLITGVLWSAKRVLSSWTEWRDLGWEWLQVKMIDWAFKNSRGRCGKMKEATEIGKE